MILLLFGILQIENGRDEADQKENLRGGVGVICNILMFGNVCFQTILKTLIFRQPKWTEKEPRVEGGREG